MNGWLRTPLPAKQGERFQYIGRQAQQVDQNGPIECLPCFILPCLVGGQHLPLLEFAEDAIGPVQLWLGEFPRIKHCKIWKFRNRQNCATLLLTGTDPPEGDEAKRGVGPEGERFFPTIIGTQEIRPGNARRLSGRA